MPLLSEASKDSYSQDLSTIKDSYSQDLSGNMQNSYSQDLSSTMQDLSGNMKDLSGNMQSSAGNMQPSAEKPIVNTIDPIPELPGGTPGGYDGGGINPAAGTGGFNPATGMDPSVSGAPTVQELYPDGGTIGPVVGADAGTVPDPVGAGGANVTETDKSATGFDAAQTSSSNDQLVDAELKRILGEDSPLLAQARADAARYANTRGLQNTSMAAGMATDAMVRAAMPMAQQNAAQAFQREGANTEFRQQAAALQAQMQTALAQQDAKAYNDAAQQLANLNRDAEAQQAELDYRASQEYANAINQRNTQTIDSITRLNQQYLQNMGAADIANIEGTYKQLIQANATAGGIWQNMLSSMAQLMDDPNMTPQQVATGMESMQLMLEASMRMLSNINNMDFGDLALPPADGSGSGGNAGRRGNSDD
jgi:hypothetical protein